jgi:hypothetical protein
MRHKAAVVMLLVFGLGTTSSAFAAGRWDYRDIHHDKDIWNDRRDLHNDYRDVHQDRRDIRNDYRDLNHDYRY